MPCRTGMMRFPGSMWGGMGRGPGMCCGPAFSSRPCWHAYGESAELARYADDLKSELERVQKAISEMEKPQA